MDLEERFDRAMRKGERQDKKLLKLKQQATQTQKGETMEQVKENIQEVTGNEIRQYLSQNTEVITNAIEKGFNDVDFSSLKKVTDEKNRVFYFQSGMYESIELNINGQTLRFKVTCFGVPQAERKEIKKKLAIFS